MELRLHCWPDYGGCGDTKKATTGRMPSRFASSKRRHGALPAWVTSAGEVLQEELAAAGCFFCYCLLLLLLQVLLLHEGTHTRCRVPERIIRQRQRCLKRARSKKSGLRHYRGKLGQSKASGESLANRMQRSNLIRPIHGSTIICFPNMTNLPIFNYICLGFVISCR